MAGINSETFRTNVERQDELFSPLLHNYINRWEGEEISRLGMARSVLTASPFGLGDARPSQGKKDDLPYDFPGRCRSQVLLPNRPKILRVMRWP